MQSNAPSSRARVATTLHSGLDLLGSATSSAALRDNSRLLSAILDSIADGVVVANLRGELVLFNRAAEQIIGLGCSATPLEDWSRHYGCFLPDTITPYPARQLPLARAIRGEEVCDEEVYIRNMHRPHGLWIRVNAAPLRDEAGQLSGGVVAFRDWTAQKRVKQRLSAQYAVSRILAEADDFLTAAQQICEALCLSLQWQAGAVFVPDSSGEKLCCWHVFHLPTLDLEDFALATRNLVCAEGVELPGLAWAAGVPLFIADLTQEPGCSRAELARQAGLQGGLLFPIRQANRLVAVFEFYHVGFGSPATVPKEPTHCTAREELTVLVGSIQTQLLLFLRRRQAEQELRRFTEDLVRSNQELEQFAYVASHDLQEPLRMVTNFCQLLQRHYTDRLDERGREYVDLARDGAERMQAMIHDLLTYARIGTRQEPLQLTDSRLVLERALRHLRVQLEETGGYVAIGSMPTIFADPGQLLQLFQNLLSNALKFHGDRPPRLTVDATPLGGSPDQTGPWGYLFRFRDEGIGIPVDAQERIFQLFERLNPVDRYPGNGMGLAIARRIVERHGGRIWVESKPGEGATFFFTWPCAGMFGRMKDEIRISSFILPTWTGKEES